MRASSLAYLLSTHADEVMAAAAPDQNRKKVVEHLFRALTDINTEGQAIRRPQTFAELMTVTGSDEPTLRAILDDFRADGVSFLSPYGDAPIGPDTLIDISHEALIRCWRKIADDKDGWLQREFKDGLTWRALIIQAESFQHDPKSVLSPARTEELGRWLEERPAPDWCQRYDGCWDDVQQLMNASRAARDEETRRRQELEEAKRREAEERARRAEEASQAADALAAKEQELRTAQERIANEQRQRADEAEVGRRQAKRLAVMAGAFALLALIGAVAAGWNW